MLSRLFLHSLDYAVCHGQNLATNKNYIRQSYASPHNTGTPVKLDYPS